MEKASEKERYIRAFSVLHHEGEVNLERKRFHLRPAASVGIALALAVGCTAAVVTSYRTIRSFFTFGNNATVSIVEEEDGTRGTQVQLHTEDLTPPVELRDGRLIFTAYGENIDISDKVSVREGYVHTHEENGMVSWIVVGLNEENNLKNFGFAEYFRTEEGKVTGYSATTNLDKHGHGPEWLEKAKRQLGVLGAD